VDLATLFDGALELTIVGSFSRVGFLLRQRVFGWQGPADGSLAGRTVLVTGSTSGLGRVAASELAALGARVVLVGRSAERLGAVRDALVAAHGEDRFPVVLADMGSLASVRAAVSCILATEARLDVLVDNAGAIYPERLVGPDGIEATLATLVVGPFVMVGGLLPLLRRTPGSRVIGVTSGGMYTQSLRPDDLQWEREPYSGARAYARAKRAQVALMREWARRLVPDGRRDAAPSPSFNAMHPGWADTPGLAASLPGFHRLMGPLLRTPHEGVDTIIWLATEPSLAGTSGGLYLDRRPRPYDRIRGTRLSAQDRRRLWDAVVELSGVPDPTATP
jgi:dehydrogenase/reductase SDR family member 12